MRSTTGLAALSAALLLSVMSAARAAYITPEARAYLQEALDVMQEHSLRKRHVDWEALRHETFERAAGAVQPVDTYEAIRFALRGLGDNHSFLQLVPELAEKERLRRPRSPVAEKNGSIASPFAKRREPESVLHKTGSCVVPQIVVPLYPSQSGDPFAARLQALIAAADANSPCGWIVDLRGNGGGNVFPMLAGIGPLLRDGDVAFSADADGRRTSFFYTGGKAGVKVPDDPAIVVTTVASPYEVKRNLPVAVLIDHGTGSSGELVAVAFRGREGTRFFGTKTAGASTATQGFQLSDGANIVLATDVDVDINGVEYRSGITPDEEIAGDLSTDGDPVIHAALQWLGQTTGKTSR